MAKEPAPVEDLPSPPGGGGGGAKTSWLPVIIIVIAVPLLTVLAWQFYMLPSLTKHIPTAAAAHGEEHAAEGGHEAAPAKEESGGHGEKGGHGGGHGESGGGGYEMKDIVANLSGSMRSRYIKVSFTLEGRSPTFKETMAANEVKLRDAALTVLSDLTLQDLEEPGIKNIVRNDLLNAFGQALRSNAIEQIYFSEFVVQ